MAINFQYKESSHYLDKRMEVYANGAPIGTLSAVSVAPDQLTWYPSDEVRNVKFQFRNQDTFFTVVEELKRYKNENGFRYLTIWSHNNGYAEIIKKELLITAGFKTLPDCNPACLFLE